ncbi:MAG: two-component system, LytTR family, response regulator [Pyrinomonadaceae bacterium]|jgi:two-component system LytT family response regulator|nr:two-component system, LytTR family, response regulator [Pyrinomonadaceae bacterium]
MTDSPPIRVLLVDDEPLARAMLREMLSSDAHVTIVGESCNGREALAAIRVHSPDLIFLDVQMPEVGGFEVLSALGKGPLPYIIFVTAYDQYAVRAFEVQALDYLLKPFDQERFDVSWQRAKAQILRDRNGGGNMDRRILALLEEMKAGNNYLERLVIKTGGRIFFLDTGEIDWIEAEGNYVSVHSAKKSHLLRETISNLEAQLDPKKFVRIHRSAIIRLDFIEELQPWFHGEYRVILQDGTQLTLSRNHREKLQEALGKLP